jgi:hypothetical protein
MLCEFILKETLDPKGNFYSAFYLWCTVSSLLARNLKLVAFRASNLLHVWWGMMWSCVYSWYLLACVYMRWECVCYVYLLVAAKS